MISLIKQDPTIHEKIDNLYSCLEQLPPVDCPVIHIFTPGMYVREILMPKGTMVISKIHNTTHPYVVSAGVCDVYNSENNLAGTITAPYTGITYPGTRRVLYIQETTIWTTFHPLDFITGDEQNWSDEEKEKLALEIESKIIIPHDVYLEINNKEELACHSERFQQE